ncbi:MAG: hypothetical protein R3261_15170, partial [Alphaproteobacteria bacterium]|nr:hypothetical protein [Alphaproteobacteria bacterium]
MIRKFCEIAPAKVNLDLFVTGKRPDGYHLLDSLVVFTEFGDKVFVEECADPSDGEIHFTVEGPNAAAIPVDDNNLVVKAAKALKNYSQTNLGVRITLEKH